MYGKVCISYLGVIIMCIMSAFNIQVINNNNINLTVLVLMLASCPESQEEQWKFFPQGLAGTVWCRHSIQCTTFVPVGQTTTKHYLDTIGCSYESMSSMIS